MTQMLGGYVRHRDRMVQESVFRDLRDTLIACRWMVGTTAGNVIDPYDPESGPTVVTTTETQVLRLAQGKPINLIDYFPEAEGESKTTPLNTFALDNGTQMESAFLELGSTATEQPYVFTMAFFATSDAMALAVFNDLRDRYAGRIVRGEVVQLWNFNSDSDIPVVNMDVDAFRYTQNTDAVTPSEVHLYFGELQLTDYVDARLVPEDPGVPIEVDAGTVLTGHGPPPEDLEVGPGIEYIDLDTGDVYESGA